MIHLNKNVKVTLLLLLFGCSVCPLHAQGLPRTFDRSDGLCDHLEFSSEDWKNHYFYTSPLISIGHPTEKLRFTVTETTSGDAGGGYPCFAIAEFYLYDTDMHAITLTAADYATNAQEPSEGPMEYICDGDYATFFHSLWSQYDETTGEHYIEVTLPQPLEAFAFGYVSRYENVAPTSITVSDPLWEEPEPLDPAENDVLTLNATETAAGEEWVITITLDTEVDYTAFQLDIALPEVFTSSTTFELFMTDGRASNTHTLTSSWPRINTLRVVSYSSDASPYASRSGDLLYIVATAHTEVPQGDYMLQAGNLRFSTPQGKEYKKEGLVADLHVSPSSGYSHVKSESSYIPTPWTLKGTRCSSSQGIQIRKGIKRLLR